jgi:sialate O-acetylesterase
MKRCIVAALAVAACLASPQARADVKLHALFSDGMVLQQGMKCPIWGTAYPGEQIRVEFQVKKLLSTVAIAAGVSADMDGKWKVILDLAPQFAGGPYSLTIKGKNTLTLKDVYVGEVWVCSGQSNMEWPVWLTDHAEEAIKNAKDSKIRLFTVPKNTADRPLTRFKDNPKWVECNPDTVRNFSAVAYFFGRDLRKARGVPVGLIHTSWGGTRAEAWTSRPVLETHEEWKGEFPVYAKAKADYPMALEKYIDALKKYKETFQGNPEMDAAPPLPPDFPRHANSPSVLYNAMIAPIIPYAIKGAIWYQGESNAGRAYAYRKLFPTMIQNWRDDWKQGDFPFLFVQLAPWIAANDKSDQTWAELREAQLLTTRNLKNTGMAVITDVGDPHDIHPRKKAPVGARWALAARALAYGEKIEYSGPVYESMKIEGDKVILSFNHVGKGLEAKGEMLQGFTVAGEDRMFHPAEAEIKGDKVVVRSDKVVKPVAVRYGWSNNPTVNLWNKDGLPASPFRTDDFPMVTGPKPAPSTR